FLPVLEGPAEELACHLAAFGVARLLVHHHPGGGGDGPCLVARGVGHEQVEVLRMGPVGGGGGGGERFTAGPDHLAGGVFHRRPGDAVLGRIGVFDVTDGVPELCHVGGDAFVALAADAGRPFHRGAVADPLLPGGAGLGEVVGEIERGAGAVGAVHHDDLRVGEVQTGVERGDGRVIP